MSYSQELAERIRLALVHLSSVREQKMFGGICFMVNEKLCIAVRKNGEMMLRCDPEQTDELLKKKGAQWAMMKGKPMKTGWLVVEPEGLEKQEDFDAWISVALDFNQRMAG